MLSAPATLHVNPIVRLQAKILCPPSRSHEPCRCTSAQSHFATCVSGKKNASRQLPKAIATGFESLRFSGQAQRFGRGTSATSRTDRAQVPPNRLLRLALRLAWKTRSASNAKMQGHGKRVFADKASGRDFERVRLPVEVLVPRAHPRVPVRLGAMSHLRLPGRVRCQKSLETGHRPAVALPKTRNRCSDVRAGPLHALTSEDAFAHWRSG